MRQSHLDAVVDLVDGDQAAHIGFLDGVGTAIRRNVVMSSGSPTASASITSPTGCDSAAETGFDQFDQSLRYDRFTLFQLQ